MYRVSGLTSEILELKDRFDSGDKIDFSRYTDISVVCGAVKLYLRELPIPVISFDTYNEVMKATSEWCVCVYVCVCVEYCSRVGLQGKRCGVWLVMK